MLFSCELEGPAISELHYDEVRRAATAARQVYEAEHCDMTTTLKYDPLHDPLHVAQCKITFKSSTP